MLMSSMSAGAENSTNDHMYSNSGEQLEEEDSEEEVIFQYGQGGPGPSAPPQDLGFGASQMDTLQAEYKSIQDSYSSRSYQWD